MWATPNLHLVTTQALLVIISLVALTDAKELTHRFSVRAISATEINVKPIIAVSFRTVDKGYRSGVHAPLQIAARSQSEWTVTWRQHTSVDSGSRLAPAVDFDKEIVVGVFLGDKPTGGYDVQITRAERSNDDLTIYYREKSPPPGGLVTQALTQPFHIVRIIREVNSEVTFRREL